jgi:D-alanine-D-alanine ligase
MKIGLTYDLRDEYLAAGYDEEATAEFDRADTIDSIENAIRSLGHETDRIGHVRQLVTRLAAGDRWDLVFNICEGMHGIAREAQVPALLEAYEIPCTFADPVVMAVCLHKGLTKTLVEKAGLPTARFAVVEQISDVDNVDLPYPLFAKPIAEGTGKGSFTGILHLIAR